MADIKKRLHTFQSHVQSIMHMVNTGPVAWSLILCIAALPAIFFLLPGIHIFLNMLGLADILIGLIIAALLRARRGALLIWFLDGVIVLCAYLFKPGMAMAGWQSIYISMNLGLLAIALIAGQMRSLGIRLGQAYSALQIAHATIQKQALTDGLTGLPNHRAIMDHLEKEVDRSQRFGRSFSLLFFDLDHFKALNDGYGHAGGDVALSSFGKLLDEGMRNLDTVGRWGGEEFVALLPETTLTEAQAIAERLRQRTSRQSFAIRGGLHLTCSIGIASYPEHADTITTLVNAADSAMYAAKRLGRNQVRVIDDPMVKVVLASEDGKGDREGVALQGVVEALASLLEQRDPSLGQHSSDVADLVHQLSCKLGISGHEAHMIKLAGQLHDIGKIGISDTILHKSAHLSEQEWTQIKGHSTAGAEIVAHIPALRPLAPVIRAHHERWDGQGYPDQLQQEEIPLAARVISVVDSYTAMIAERPYQKARSPQDAVAELQRCAGTQFDPRIVEALIGYLEEQVADIRAAVQVA